MQRTQPRHEFENISRQLDQMVGRVWQWKFGDYSPIDSWSPNVNVYKVGEKIEVCVDLAGVAVKSIDVQVEPGTLAIRGVRQAPEPPREADSQMRILAMEIDHGPFCRTIRLPEQINLSRVTSRYVDGMLWVTLPLRDIG